MNISFANLFIVYLISFLFLMFILDKNLNFYWKIFCAVSCILISMEAFLMGSGSYILKFITALIR